MREAYVPSGEAELVAPGRSLAEATRRRMELALASHYVGRRRLRCLFVMLAALITKRMRRFTLHRMARPTYLPPFPLES